METLAKLIDYIGLGDDARTYRIWYVMGLVFFLFYDSSLFAEAYFWIVSPLAATLAGFFITVALMALNVALALVGAIFGILGDLSRFFSKDTKHA